MIWLDYIIRRLAIWRANRIIRRWHKRRAGEKGA